MTAPSDPSDRSRALFVTDRLRVRALEDRDVDGLQSVYGDESAMRFVDDGRAITREECERWLAVTRSNYERRGYGMCALELLESRELVGYCGLVHPGGQLEVEVKYALRRGMWGRGLATEAVRGLLRYARRRHGIDAVIAILDARNVASRRVLEKCGFTAGEPGPGSFDLLMSCSLGEGA
jgi:ribosomal-protein-alanine N-acetyltransferase